MDSMFGDVLILFYDNDLWDVYLRMKSKKQKPSRVVTYTPERQQVLTKLSGEWDILELYADAFVS